MIKTMVPENHSPLIYNNSTAEENEHDRMRNESVNVQKKA